MVVNCNYITLRYCKPIIIYIIYIETRAKVQVFTANYRGSDLQSSVPVENRCPCLIQCYLDHTNVLAKWHLIPSNGARV